METGYDGHLLAEAQSRLFGLDGAFNHRMESRN